MLCAFWDAELVCGGENLDTEVHEACGSDMMSDVLAYVKDQAVLLTGLVNIQTVRTADMMDMVCIVFVRGKSPDADMIRPGRAAGDGPFKNHPPDVHGLRPLMGKRPAGRERR